MKSKTWEKEFKSMANMNRWAFWMEGIKFIKKLLKEEFEKGWQTGHKQTKSDYRDLIKKNIGKLRQWINERPQDMPVTNGDIEEWLFDKNGGEKTS